MKNKLIPYAMDFSSFLISNLDVSNLRSVTLFGSAARGDFSKNSDVDIFVDIITPEKRIEKNVNKIIKMFEGSKTFEKWGLLGVKNPISVKVGNLDQWGSLKSSIISDGIILFGKYSSNTEGSLYTIISWGAIKPESKRVLLNKRLFGYQHKNKRYPGLLEKSEGSKLGNSVLIPLELSTPISNLFKSMKVKTKVLNVEEQ